MEGWIKLHRKFLDWEWYTVDEMVKLFIHLLLSANHEDNTWRGIKIERGQLVTGINSLHEKTKIPIQTLRTCLSRLEKTGEINKQSTNKYTIITICNYNSYQVYETTTNKQPNKRVTNNQQTTNYKQECKERKEDIYKSFCNDLLTQLQELVKTPSEAEKIQLNKFYAYWTEPNISKTKPRYKMEKTWDLKRRLNIWMQNAAKFEKK
jgi:hypothetical protein